MTFFTLNMLDGHVRHYGIAHIHICMYLISPKSTDKNTTFRLNLLLFRFSNRIRQMLNFIYRFFFFLS